MLENVQIHPINRGAFSRHFDLLAREDSLGDVPERIAKTAQDLLKDEIMPRLYGKIPWLEDKLNWDEDAIEP